MDELAAGILDILKGYEQPYTVKRVAHTPLTLITKACFTEPTEQLPEGLQEKYGLENIAADYRLPGLLAPQDLKDYCAALKAFDADTRLDRLAELVSGLGARNPELKELKFTETADTLAIIVRSVADGYNAADIQERLTRVEYGTDSADSWYNAMKKKVECSIGMLAWEPALSTLTSINNQMSRKMKDPAYELPDRSGIVVQRQEPLDMDMLFI